MSNIDPNSLECIKELARTSRGKITLVRSPNGECMVCKQLLRAKITTQKQAEHVWNEKASLQHFTNKHPHLPIPKLLGTGKDDEYVKLYISFFSGAPLHYHIQSEKGFDETHAQVYTKQIARIFLTLHSDGFAYRDLKASNIMLHGGRCRLIDFGYCKQVGDPPRAETPCGTSHAMPPEMHIRFLPDANLEEAYDAFLVDWWTLGILAYEMMNIKPPYGFHPDKKPEDFLELARGAPSNIEWPPILSKEGQDFISQLLNPDVDTRLRGDAVLEHPWLKDVDDSLIPSWDDLLGHHVDDGQDWSPEAGDPFEDFCTPLPD